MSRTQIEVSTATTTKEIYSVFMIFNTRLGS